MSAIGAAGPMWLIGCGNMAGAMLGRWLEAGLDPARVTVVRPSGGFAGEGVRVVTSVPGGDAPALVLLGVKPQKLDEVAPTLSPALAPDTILISILAGVELSALRVRFPTPRTIVRAMPNMPVRLGKGVVDLHGEPVGKGDRETVTALMTPLGLAEWFEEETAFALAGHLTGAGPAFLFRLIDALAAAGAKLGLPPEQSARLATAMAEGAVALAVASAETPAELARRVASPGGTTEAGLEVLDREEGLLRLIHQTLAASRQRGLDMAAAARVGSQGSL